MTASWEFAFVLPTFLLLGLTGIEFTILFLRYRSAGLRISRIVSLAALIGLLAIAGFAAAMDGWSIQPIFTYFGVLLVLLSMHAVLMVFLLRSTRSINGPDRNGETTPTREIRNSPASPGSDTADNRNVPQRHKER